MAEVTIKINTGNFINPLKFDYCEACVFCNDKRCKLLDVDIADPYEGRLFLCPIVSISINMEGRAQ